MLGRKGLVTAGKAISLRSAAFLARRCAAFA
jgi:hypothetical protein